MAEEESGFRERKRLWDGGEETFPLQVLRRGEGWLLAGHITGREYSVGPLRIPRGVESLGVFVEGANWVLYSWLSSPSPLGVYLNAARGVEIREREVVWEDLLLDILYLPGGVRHILDYEEAVEVLGETVAAEVLRALEGVEREALRLSGEVLRKSEVHSRWWPIGNS